MRAAAVAPGARVPVAVYFTEDTLAVSLPVHGRPGQGITDITRLVIPVRPGDLLFVTAQARVTDNTRPTPRYTKGVGYQLWIADPSRRGLARKRIGPSGGDNVDDARHHMPLMTHAVWEVAGDWTGPTATIIFTGDAMSTRWQAGDVITVDAGYTLVSVVRWSVPT
jgi:hypothetical protein